jgi:erythrocyte band 7 integral membrane protein
MQDFKSMEPLWDPSKPVHFSVCEYILMFLAWFLALVIPIFWFFIIKTVRDYERCLIFRLGKLKGGAEGPGVFFVNPFMDSMVVVDLRMETFDLPPQGMMTMDAVTVDVDAISFLKVIDPIKAILEVDDYRFAFKNISATTLRSVIGTYDLQALLSERDEINEKIRTIIEDETSSWGVAVPAVEIKDVKLPSNMQRAMAAEAEAERERRAKIVSAAGEAEAAKQLAIAADTISDSPGALQLRYLHTLVKISAEKNSTILFPLPMEVMRGIQQFSNIQEENQIRRRRNQVREENNNNNNNGNELLMA